MYFASFSGELTKKELYGTLTSSHVLLVGGPANAGALPVCCLLSANVRAPCSTHFLDKAEMPQDYLPFS